jgi:hypothetical protein
MKTMFLKLSLAAICFACTGCAGTSTQTVVKDVTIGLDAAICVLNTYPADVAKGMTEPQAILDTAIACGVTVVQASGILAAHKKAEVLEGFVPKPASK